MVVWQILPPTFPGHHLKRTPVRCSIHHRPHHPLSRPCPWRYGTPLRYRHPVLTPLLTGAPSHHTANPNPGTAVVPSLPYSSTARHDATFLGHPYLETQAHTDDSILAPRAHRPGAHRIIPSPSHPKASDECELLQASSAAAREAGATSVICKHTPQRPTDVCLVLHLPAEGRNRADLF
jgi:hypothetical protein